MNRRKFINMSAIAAGSTMVIGVNSGMFAQTKKSDFTNVNNLHSMTEDVKPITLEERKNRIYKAQQLMQQENIDCLLLDSGTSMKYFTGISWGASERPMIVVIPSKGDIRYICPAFEEPRLRELIVFGHHIYTWQEDESPFKQAALAINDAGISSGNIGVEERMRFFIFNGIHKEIPQLNLVSGDPITIPCRMIKSNAEIALMQKATDITLKAIAFGFASLKEGSTPSDFSNAVAMAHQNLGARHQFAGCNFAEASAFPHGSTTQQILKKGDIVLVDCGCTVEGYQSDISRTIVYDATPTKRQVDFWNLEKRAQAAGFKAAQLGTPLKNVDEAARKVLTDAGFGPEYKLPGLPHRTGHGIGMDGHEWGNAIKGNNELLVPGMCFSIEPNISIVGEFGIRLEDCVYMTSEGPQWFSQPSPSIDRPFV
ncbi:Xaa-Pro peptidase family protein [Gelidibacter sp.]|uniref:M24 family metallopeptidase n=2 Tax=Gelidibacter sp. TaxID=2018083 RepID=UPI00326523CB